eukprot:PhM_4_TR13731/c6_g3_i1/m.25176/K06276/PDPK1; 3-phosphoinositide dependent protein kinase-1
MTTTYTIPECMTVLPRDNFTISDKMLGEGGFAKVMIGTRNDTGERVAVKIMDKAMCARAEKSAFTNVQNEIDIISELSHPSIVNCLAIFQDDEKLFFVLEFCEGGELFKYMKKYGLEDMQVVARNFVAEVIIALDYMMGKGIAHRDIKPENLLLTKDFHVKVADFGTACRVDSPDNKFSGTSWYVSPEVILNAAASNVSDVWALGCTVYQLFVGSPPFKRDTDFLTFQAIKARDLSFPPYFPADAAALVEKMLTVDPAARPGSGPNGLLGDIKNEPFFTGLEWDSLHTLSNVTHLNDDYTTRWQPFLLKGEEVVYAGIIVKTRHLVSQKKRHLILTTFPRLFYVDPDTMELKGQVPWSDDLWASAASSKEFNVVTPGRTYIFADGENHAHIWASKINSFVKQKKASKK